jgi:hypothetical protein
MSTAQEILEAIRCLSSSERDKLLRDLPSNLPGLDGNAQWDRIIRDEAPRGALTELLNETEAEYAQDPDKFPPMTTTGLSANR